MKLPLRILAAAALLGSADSLTGQEVPQEVGERIAVLADKRINESSGLALSQRDPSIFWTLNDSGGEPCLFAIDQKGKTRAKVRIRDAANFDWEGLATAKGSVLIGDIGDNLHVRPTVQIYQLEEPPLPPPAEAAKEIESAKPTIWHLTYPDGKHNAEGLLVHPVTGRIYIITKSDDGRSALYAAPEVLRKDKAMVLEKVSDLTFAPRIRVGKRPKDASLVTAAEFSPDGRRLVVATYSYLHEWRLGDGESLATALARPSTVIMPIPLGGVEAACYDADSQSLWLTSEGLPTPLVRISRKD